MAEWWWRWRWRSGGGGGGGGSGGGGVGGGGGGGSDGGGGGGGGDGGAGGHVIKAIRKAAYSYYLIKPSMDHTELRRIHQEDKAFKRSRLSGFQNIARTFKNSHDGRFALNFIAPNVLRKMTRKRFTKGRGTLIF